MDNLHTRIKTARLNRGFSQARLAEETGVSQPTIANWENGSHIPRKHAMIRISEVLDVEEAWLLSGLAGRTKQSVEAYLALPIRHVPIYEWPAPGEGLFAQPPEGYIPYPTVIEKAFALVDRTEKEIRHRIMIFDPHAEPLKPLDKYLWSDGFTARIDSVKAVPPDGRVLGRLKTEIKSY